MHVLVLCDDRWHPASTPRQGLAPLEGQDFAFDYLEDARGWSPERMVSYPVTILTKSNDTTAADHTPWMTPEAELAFRDYVRGGGGLLVIHSGSASYKEQRTLRSLIGGVFDHHPPQCDVTVEPSAGHPLAASVTPFTARDEHYMMELDAADAEIFLTTRSQHGAQPGGWTRAEGAGRVCLLTPGHNLEVWLHPAYQALLASALRWCAPRETI
jgi:type 1 glutamine amidotransferase